MSQEKVDKYKSEKADRRKSLKKEKRKKTAIYACCAVVLLAVAAFGGYQFGNTAGYERGYTEAFNFATSIYQSTLPADGTATGGAVTSGGAVSGSSEGANE